MALKWSSPFQSMQSIPTERLYPVTPGGYVVENLRHVGDLSAQAVTDDQGK